MEIIKIKVHSFVDVITNSSTTIYSYYSGCIKPIKEMIDSFIKLTGSDLKADDMFYFGVFCDIYKYTEYEGDKGIDTNLEKMRTLNYLEADKFINDLILDIITGKIEQPKWMSYAEDSTNEYDYEPENFLYIVPKDEKYAELAKQIEKVITSPSHEAFRDG